MGTIGKNILILIFMLIMLAFISKDAEAKVNCDKHPIFCQIKKNNKKIDKKYAMKLSNIIYKATRTYHIPPRIFTAILAQESQYSLQAKGCHRGIVYIPRPPMSDIEYADHNTEVTATYQEVKVCSDFGIGQIYFKTAKGYGFNIDLLVSDLNYSVNAAAKVLADFQKRYEAKEVDWWTRYNARSKTKRQIYKTLVERYL
jgi:hypothetical protein